MKAHLLAAIIMAAAMAAPATHAAGSRDDAVANLAGKEAEARVLREQLASWNKMKTDATAAIRPLKDRYFDRLDDLKNAAAGTEHLIRGEILMLEGKITENETRKQIAEEQAAAINARLAQLDGEIAGARTALQNFNPRPNEPPGGIKLGGSDYVPAPGPGEKPGLTTSLPGWAAPSPGQTANTGGGGSSTPTPPYPPMLMPPGSPGWSGQTPAPFPPSSFTGPMNPWGPF
ncbi:MAG: hypothetical protein HZA91_20935 [Verrucomicrobia bacterium]|nr:hypothetical protein [Verrucomicrobiota bacterium]